MYLTAARNFSSYMKYELSRKSCTALSAFSVVVIAKYLQMLCSTDFKTEFIFFFFFFHPVDLTEENLRWATSNGGKVGLLMHYEMPHICSHSADQHVIKLNFRKRVWCHLDHCCGYFYLSIVLLQKYIFGSFTQEDCVYFSFLGYFGLRQTSSASFVASEL